jgi:hypothetical protein
VGWVGIEVKTVAIAAMCARCACSAALPAVLVIGEVLVGVMRQGEALPIAKSQPLVDMVLAARNENRWKMLRLLPNTEPRATPFSRSASMTARAAIIAVGLRVGAGASAVCEAAFAITAMTA